MTTGVINKIEITPEAVFDYEHGLSGYSGPSWEKILEEAGGIQADAFSLAEAYEQPTLKLDKRALKREVEDCIDLMNRGGRLLYEDYFRCLYYDERSDKMLMLFLYRAEKLSIMQYWRLMGISLADGWDEDAEYSGRVRTWLEGKITDLEKGDWVFEQIARAEADRLLMGWTVHGSIIGIPKEAKNAIEYGGNKTTA